MYGSEGFVIVQAVILKAKNNKKNKDYNIHWNSEALWNCKKTQSW